MHEDDLAAVHRGEKSVRQGQLPTLPGPDAPLQVGQVGPPDVPRRTAKPGQGMPQHLDGYRRMIRSESGAIKADPGWGLLDHRRLPRLPGGGLEESPRRAQRLGRRREDARRPGLDLALE
jgi:hypothetical protein